MRWRGRPQTQVVDRRGERKTGRNVRAMTNVVDKDGRQLPSDEWDKFSSKYQSDDNYRGKQFAVGPQNENLTQEVQSKTNQHERAASANQSYNAPKPMPRHRRYFNEGGIVKLKYVVPNRRGK